MLCMYVSEKNHSNYFSDDHQGYFIFYGSPKRFHRFKVKLMFTRKIISIDINLNVCK